MFFDEKTPQTGSVRRRFQRQILFRIPKNGLKLKAAISGEQIAELH
jgi:hypothetical protein